MSSMFKSPETKLGKAMFDWRLQLGLTQSQASARLGKYHSAWSQWESGKKLPTITTLRKICTLIGVEPRDVIE